MSEIKPRNLRPLTEYFDNSDKQGFGYYAIKFINHLQVKNFAESTLTMRIQHLKAFIRWAQERDITQPDQLNPDHLEHYQRYLYNYRKPDRKELTVGTQHNRLSCVRSFFGWLYSRRYIRDNPSVELELPQVPKRLPKVILTVQEVETVLAQPDIQTPIGIRDRTILETFYSTAMRRIELVSLKINDIQFEKSCIFIHKGKGNADRYVPVGHRALEWIKHYLTYARPKIAPNTESEYLFLTTRNAPFHPETVNRIVKRYFEKADIGKKGGCHIWRHSCATLMLENGADIREIQQLLGHENLNNTAIYTKINIRHLQEVHAKTHPAEKKDPT